MKLNHILCEQLKSQSEKNYYALVLLSFERNLLIPPSPLGYTGSPSRLLFYALLVHNLIRPHLYVLPRFSPNPHSQGAKLRF